MIEKLDKDKIYRYLGYNKSKHLLTQEMESMVNETITEILKVVDPKVVFSNKIDFVIQDENISSSVLTLKGNDIRAHLKDCYSYILMGVTLGSRVDALIRKTEMTNMAKAVIQEAVANVCIETVADKYENELRDKLIKTEDYLTMRYSPGYGDLDISIQNDIIRLLDAPRKIGLTVTSSNIMIPKKSITAILGVAKVKVTGKLSGCKTCALKDKCIYRERGTTCEK